MKKEKLIDGQICYYVGPLSNEQFNILNPLNAEVIMSAEKIDGEWHYWVEETFALSYLEKQNANRDSNQSEKI